MAFENKGGKRILSLMIIRRGSRNTRACHHAGSSFLAKGKFNLDIHRAEVAGAPIEIFTVSVMRRDAVIFRHLREHVAPAQDSRRRDVRRPRHNLRRTRES